MVAMGGFMAAATAAVLANNRSRRKQESESASKDAYTISVQKAEVAAREQAVLLREASDERRVQCEKSRIEAERALGRRETREETISRECELFGFSPSSMTLQ